MDNSIPNHNSAILYHNFYGELIDNDFDSFDNYMKKEFLPRLVKNENVSNVVIQYLSELFVNSRTHGKTKNIICGGQLYSTKNKMRFIIVDFGVTIPYNIEKHIIKNKLNYFHDNDGDAIRWSTKEGNSTKETLGGLGLNSIKEFISEYKGKILIISRKGTYEYHNYYDRVSNSNVNFGGTLVFIELDLNELNRINKPTSTHEVFSI